MLMGNIIAPALALAVLLLPPAAVASRDSAALTASPVLLNDRPLAGNAMALQMGAYQYPDGAIPVTANGPFVDPYFAIKALLCARDAGMDIHQAGGAWVAWLLPRQKPDGRFQRYGLSGGGTWQAVADADADDALLALWIHLLYALAPNAGLPPNWQASVDAAQAALASMADAAGVYTISADNPVALFMDNVEIYGALRGVAQAQWRMGNSLAALQTGADATLLGDAVNGVFWLPGAGRYQISTQESTSFSFYPDVVAQTYPQLNGMPTPDGDPAAAFARWLSTYETAWLDMEQDDYPWGLVALTALRMNDTATAYQWLAQEGRWRHTSHWNVLEEAIYMAIRSQTPMVPPFSGVASGSPKRGAAPLKPPLRRQSKQLSHGHATTTLP